MVRSLPSDGPDTRASGRRPRGKTRSGTLNVDANPETAMRFDVLTLPTILVFSNGEVAKRIVGHVPAPRLASEFAPWVGSAGPFIR